MKNVLLIGELNQTVSNLNKYLTGSFRTQVCADSLELITGMEKVFKPDLVVVCLMGIGELDSKILDFFREKGTKTPVLLVGTGEECRNYVEYYDGQQFDYAVRPMTQSALLKKCSEMLKMNSSDVEKEVTMFQSAVNRRMRILVVDDSALSLRTIKSILDKKYDITVAMSGEEAIPAAKKKQPDLILLDYEMPGWDGRRTLEEIRRDEELRDIPVMFLTGVADKKHIAAVLGLNPAGYLLKPVEQNKLLDEIGKVFGK